MKVHEFLKVCPHDHEITFCFNTTKRQVYLENMSWLYDKTKNITLGELNEEIEGFYAEDLKCLYIWTKKQ